MACLLNGSGLSSRIITHLILIKLGRFKHVWSNPFTKLNYELNNARANPIALALNPFILFLILAYGDFFHLQRLGEGFSKRGTPSTIPVTPPVHLDSSWASLLTSASLPHGGSPQAVGRVKKRDRDWNLETTPCSPHYSSCSHALQFPPPLLLLFWDLKAIHPTFNHFFPFFHSQSRWPMLTSSFLHLPLAFEGGIWCLWASIPGSS